MTTPAHHQLPTPPPALALEAITAGYGATTVLRDVTVTVPAGKVIALLGPNGAGKTTLLSVAAGLIKPTAGTITAADHTITTQRPAARTRAGICLIPEGRGIFPNLTVRENLQLQIPPWHTDTTIEPALETFPALRDRLGQQAGSMSGGQQQMLALSRCFLADPKVVLLDEVSMGLAPAIIDEIFTALTQLAATGVALLLVEQYVSRALAMAHEAYLLDRGTISHHGPANQLNPNDLMQHYTGTSQTTNTSPA
jgi:branched-chain amino acid transport system ATP-binding protein